MTTSLPDMGIVHFFSPDGASRCVTVVMTGSNDCIVGERKKFVMNGRNKGFPLAAVEVCSPHRADKKGVAGKDHPRVVKTNAAGGMARCVNHLKGGFSYTY